MYKDYFTRVTSTYNILKKTTIFLDKEGDGLRRLLLDNDKYLASKDFREQPYPLSFALSKDSVMIDFLGYDYQVNKRSMTQLLSLLCFSLMVKWFINQQAIFLFVLNIPVKCKGFLI